MSIAIMGATGKLGRPTLDHLRARVGAENIVAVTRSPERAADLAALGVQVRQGDYADRASLQRAFSGVHTVHLIPGMAMPRERVQHVSNAIEAAQAAGVQRLVHVGIVGTDVTNPFAIMPYLLYAESAVVTSGLRWTLLRNAYYAEPVAEWLPEIVRLGTIPYPTGSGRHPWATRADMGRAAAAVLASDAHDGQRYDLTGPEALRVQDLCELAARVTGQPIVHRPATDEDYVQASIEGGEPAPFARLLATLYAPVRMGMTGFTTDHIERLGGQAPAPMEQVMRAAWRG